MAPRDAWRDRLDDVNAGRKPRDFESAVAHFETGPEPGQRRVRSRMLRMMMAAVLAWPIAFFTLPLLRDGRGGPCQALETRLRVFFTAGVSPAAFSGDVRELASQLASMRRDVVLDGTTARHHVAAQGDGRPVWLGCYLRYWTVALSL